MSDNSHENHVSEKELEKAFIKLLYLEGLITEELSNVAKAIIEESR